MDILSGLNDKQREAVLATRGPVLILAGAGSGKTKALTHRIAYLIKDYNINPQNILAVTFTNKAAEEMKKRIAKLLESNNKILPWMGTFHAISVKILRQEIHNLGYRRHFTIYDEQDSLSLIKKTMKDLNIDAKEYNPKSVKNFISGAKNELIGAKEYPQYAESYFQEIVAKIFEQYQKNLKLANGLDFDDLLMLTVQLFREFPLILEKYQNIFHYIMIDEYQDTNTAQYTLVKLLAQKHKNICVVGDDYQAIYGFRGANFKNILNFEKDYPQAKVIKMEQNYRSTQNILSAADKIIKQNTNRTDKTLWTENLEGAPITVYEASNEHDEIDFIVNEIESLCNNETTKQLNNFVILYRTNAQSRVIEEVLLKHNIPYRLIGAYRFYERKEIKDIMAYLRLISNPTDRVSLERIINVPPRGIGPKTLAQVENPKLQNFYHLLEELRSKSQVLRIDELIDYVADKTGYKLWTLDKTEEGEMRWENIQELKSVARESETLEEFLEKVALVSDIDKYDQNLQAITLMTLHNAKGLEFPVVFMAGMEEGLFPHSLTFSDPTDLEEERRLCYVGMTRAKERLYLSHCLSRLIFGEMKMNLHSRFIDEIPEDLLDKI